MNAIWTPGLILLSVTENPAEILRTLTPGRIITVILVLTAACLLGRIFRSFLEALSRRVPRARFFFMMQLPIVLALIWVSASLFVIWVVSPTSSTQLAILASAGLALGFGAQDLVRNLLGGIMVLVIRPFQLGDRVKIGEAYGEIDHIGLLGTKLTTPDDTRVTIPNGLLLSGMAWNANSGSPDCQVVTDLFVPIGTDPATAVEIGQESAYSSPYLLLTKPVVVNLMDRFQDRPYLLVRIKAYVYDHRFEPRFQSDITLRAKAEFLRRGLLQPWMQSPTDGGARPLSSVG
jgi:small-conductance mechanosensitive channel